MKTKPLLAACILLACVVPVIAGDDDSAASGKVAGVAPEEHWAWTPPVRPSLPVVKDTAWVRNAIDRFILAGLETAGLRPAPAAAREQIIRRVTLDLIGLPPTPAEIDAFLQDAAPDALERVIDRLLASPHYGERWGRHWLDLARFADSNGYEFDEARPDAWRYRDYVIESFNADKPYDRFIQEQLAGDELWPDDPQALVATGFNLLGPDMTDASDQAARRQNTLNDMTDTAGLAFLGMTLACARCHDHKFEPIPQADYYRFQAFFAPSDFRLDVVVAPPAMKARHDKAMQGYLAVIRPTQDAIATLESPYRQKIYEGKLAKLAEAARIAHQTPPEKRTAAQNELITRTTRFLTISPQELASAMTDADKAKHQDMQSQLKKFDHLRPAPLPAAMGLRDRPGPIRKTFILERGELGHNAEEVQPGYPSVLIKDRSLEPAKLGNGRRAALARWITRADNPLTARVLVNRLWQHHFGRGLVPTPSDLGVRGERPTHRELLDWLAVEFVEGGWCLKTMHKLMLLSATYQQSSQPSAAAMEKDPANRLFSRWNRTRLEGESIRDGLLAVSGRLSRVMGGPGVFPPMPLVASQVSKAWPVSPKTEDHVRRSVYIFARRNLRFPFLETFDLPDSTLSCPKRERSTTAPQALAMLNSTDVAAAAEALAARLQREANTDEERITLACRLVLSRAPTPAEMRLAQEFLEQSPWSEFCRALLNVNEFIYVD